MISKENMLENQWGLYTEGDTDSSKIIWLDGDRKHSKIQEGRLLKLSGAENSSVESQFCAGREKKYGQHFFYAFSSNVNRLVRHHEFMTSSPAISWTTFPSGEARTTPVLFVLVSGLRHNIVMDMFRLHHQCRMHLSCLMNFGDADYVLPLSVYAPTKTCIEIHVP